jgi:hypothetical protein
LSLQFHPATGYFFMVLRAAIPWVAVVLLAGCGTRDRVTFPTEGTGDGAGPHTDITQPAASDTTVTGGDLLFVQGRTFDPDGIDAVYFEVDGANQGFAPIPGEGADTVNFAVQLSTLNTTKATVVMRVYGIDRLGTQGAAASRLIRIE